jgi:hypothetical protein
MIVKRAFVLQHNTSYLCLVFRKQMQKKIIFSVFNHRMSACAHVALGSGLAVSDARVARSSVQSINVQFFC